MGLGLMPWAEPPEAAGVGGEARAPEAEVVAVEEDFHAAGGGPSG